MTLKLNNTNSLSDTYATIEYVDSLIVASGGVSQQGVDDSIALLISKDVAYNNTLTSHRSPIDTNIAFIATHTNGIAVLNTKQLLGLDIRSADFFLCFAFSRTRERNLGLVPHKDLPETIAVVTRLLNNRR